MGMSLQLVSESYPVEVTKEEITATQEAMRDMPQAPAMKTTHFFAGGMYCRRIEIPRGNVIVSKVHKTEHLFIGCVGRLAVGGQGENYEIGPGDVVPSAVGTKRIVVAITDVVVMTIHKTNKQTLEGLEEELMVFDETAMYDVNNCPKPGVLIADYRYSKLEGE